MRTLLRPRAVLVRAFGDEVTTLGPNVLMTEHTHPFDLSFAVWATSLDQDKLPVGDHAFPFEFVLPTALPPTFRGELTQIAYRIETKVDVPLHSDLHAEQALIVQVPLLVDADKPLRSSASTTDGLKLELELNASGCYPGDHVSGQLHLSGATSANVKTANVDLISYEKGEAREFVDHFEKLRVRIEIEPKVLTAGQPFPIELPIPEDADPSFSGVHSAKSRRVRATVTLTDGRTLTTEAVLRVGQH